MIARFNFYDVYGYLLPGLVLLSIFWAPLGLVYNKWPTGDLDKALLAIPLAYVAGHILQIFAVRVFPSAAGNGRYPSDLLLDETNTTFSSEFKAKLARRIRESFGLIVTGHGNKETSRHRSDALFLCRSALIKAKTASYGEQFEGMYSLMRGATVAFLLGAFHLAGWCLLLIPDSKLWIGPEALPCLIVALCLAIALEFSQPAAPTKPGRKRAIASFASFGFALLCGGYLLGAGQTIGARKLYLLLALMLISLLLSKKCFQSYQSFTWEFAKAVYRDFLTYEKPHGEEKPVE
jgi:hypothetical protein